jgi:hypothetical protein
MVAMRPAFAVLVVFHVDIELAADQRLNSRIHGLDRKFKRAEKIVGVGDRQRRLFIGERALDQRLDRQRAFEQGIGRMEPANGQSRALRVRVACEAT